LIGDIDIKIRETDETEVGDEIHTEKHIKDIVDIYQSVLRIFTNIPVCLVLPLLNCIKFF